MPAPRQQRAVDEAYGRLKAQAVAARRRQRPPLHSDDDDLVIGARAADVETILGALLDAVAPTLPVVRPALDLDVDHQQAAGA